MHGDDFASVEVQGLLSLGLGVIFGDELVMMM